ncbi:hypothetical protein L2E82_40814 [Cichorium intybus]|uniref:Uncharacterized protein n=1 Tax=Cichorium intybus TaxID=13427 RepID=A0ACB9AME6_CICIN|nr:hypothetical protein L2E82_40814 [Cichorium intybus]
METETTVSPAHDGGFEERSSTNPDVFISSGEFLDMINRSAGLASSSVSQDHHTSYPAGVRVQTQDLDDYESPWLLERLDVPRSGINPVVGSIRCN